ncbi:NUDIX domain-containing protein [Tsukamurella sp. 8F]|uniref:NUDIX hydrolase n=1 Tax=unclassified Tsukamurella TaxID=2633480 RepID=UPI0023B8E63D|nr:MULTISPECIES: NUDIX domain-containing protein [unclassified Tsukamurella]MDF0530382.1 NUDIX domain-containing protein [Tsukamurella sp. 8J]MDF0587679.1 NUDIX domain-containing protein [Tsukamurella sp. 8F]
MSFTTLHTTAVDALARFDARTDADDSLRHTVLAFLDAQPNACARANVPGHITASVVLLNAARTHVALTHHPRVGEWLQLGGHCEDVDSTIAGAALREAREESGLDDIEVSDDLLTLHTHPITCSLGVPTRHLDLRFLAVAGGRVLPDLAISDESNDLRWWPVDALPDSAERTTVAHQVRAALARS